MEDEIKKGPVIIYSKEEYWNKTDADVHAFTEDHSINDVLRWLISESSKEEVARCLELTE